MADTDNTVPWRLWEHHGLRYTKSIRRYRPAHRGSCIADDVRLASRRQRRLARQQLRAGVEPAPYRPRHEAQWRAL